MTDSNSIADMIFDCLQMVSDENRGFYNVGSGKVLWLCGYPDDYGESSAFLEENEDKFIALPTQYDINEYMMMKKFTLNYVDERISADLSECLNGKGAFRHFKDRVIQLGIESEWYAYRDEQYRAIAREWCEKSGLLADEQE